MADTEIYTRLKKLFSTSVVVRHVGGKKLKVADTDSVQSFLSNSMRDRYARIHSAAGYQSAFNSQYAINMAYQTQRIMLFRDYDVMDNDPIINSALDIYADESTVKSEYGEVLTIHSENAEVKEILHNLFYDILNIEFNLWWWVRQMAKYGDFFLFLEISPNYGIINVMPLSVYDTVRIEGEDPKNPYYVYFETMGANGYRQKFENFELAHFRLLSDGNFLPYGKAMIEGARRAFRQLVLMEDAMMIHRIMRAPEKRIFKVDIGHLPPNEVDNFIKTMMDRTKKTPFIDSQTGEYNLRYNMQNLLEDFWIPVRGKDSGTDISNLGGLEYNPIDDIEYIRNKMLAGLKIPKAFLGYEEQLSGKTTLAAEDIRFSRTIERIQRIIISELTKIAVVHLYAQGYQDQELVNFSLSLTTPSTIAEQEKVNLWTQRVGLIQQLQGVNVVSSEWMYDQILEISPEDAAREKDRLVEDKKFLFRLGQIEQGNSDPAKFGYPQDQQPQEPMAGQEAGAAPGGAAKSIDDLPTEDELGGKQNESELRGRPEKGMTYGQDSHPRGRDPLGLKAQYKAMKVSPERTSKRSALSLETKFQLNNLDKIRPKTSKSTLTEGISDPDHGTLLDEKQLLKSKDEH